jgi:hypothetical protein
VRATAQRDRDIAERERRAAERHPG